MNMHVCAYVSVCKNPEFNQFLSSTATVELKAWMSESVEGRASRLGWVPGKTQVRAFKEWV